MIEGLVVGEVHPPDPRDNDTLGIMRCDGCEAEFPCHLEAFHSGSGTHRCGGSWSWRPAEVGSTSQGS